MKILVLGENGQLARSLATIPLQGEDAIITVGRPTLDFLAVATIEKVISETQPDLVVNAAAYTAVDTAETEVQSAFAINKDAVGKIAKQCQKQGVPLIHVSTDYVFDGSKQGAYTETDLVSPSGVYGQSKFEGEQLVQDLCSHHIILRTAWVYSPFGHNFVKTMLRLAADRDEIGVVGDQIGSPTYAPHLAQAIYQMARQIQSGKNIIWGIYNAAGTGRANWAELAEEVFSCSKIYNGASAHVNAITTSDYPTPAKRPANSELDCRKLSQNFGFSFPDWREGVSECVERLLGDPLDAS